MAVNFSIIIPHKNIPELLVRCLDSIPERADIQVIVVDDNSDNADLYPELYPELFRPFTEVYFTKEGKGAGYARNVGLKHIKGKWIIFADADDFFLSDWTRHTDSFLDSDADIIQFRIADVLYHTDCGWHNQSIDDYWAGKKTTKKVLFSIISCWAKMFSADFLRQNDILFEEIKCAEDVPFGYQVAVKANKIAISQDAIYNVTYREGSLTTIKNKEFNWIRYTALRRAYAFAEKHGYQQYVLSPAIEVLKSWRQLGLRDYLCFIWHERHEIRRASKIQMESKPFNYRHPYLYVLLVLINLV